MKPILRCFLIVISFYGYSQRTVNKHIVNNFKNIPSKRADFMSKTLNPTWKVNATANKIAKLANNQANNCSCQVTLAVSSISLKAERKDAEKVSLTWQATELTNSNKFEIERSINAKAFTNIGFLISKNIKSESDYNYSDTNDNEDFTYYRIKENDLNGKVIYSNIVAVTGAEIESKIIISPNPSSDKISISLLSEINAEGNFTFFAASGKQVLQKSIQLEKGKNNTTIDISEFAIGTYFLQINNGKNKVAKKVVKL